MSNDATIFQNLELSQGIRVNDYHRALEVDELVDREGDWSNAFQYGLPAAIVSGTVGTINTGVAFANMLGADFESVSTSEVLNDWGMENTASYYEDHRSTIDAVGFGLSAIIPGVAGFKAAQMVQKGIVNRAGSVNAVTGWRKVLVPENYGNKYLAAVKNETESISRFTLKRKAAQQGFHQNLVETSFAETAILLTNAKNPSISSADQSYHEAVMNNVGGLAFGIGFGTVIGGAISSTIQYATLRNVYQSSEKASNAMGFAGKYTSAGFPVGSNVGDNITMMWAQKETMQKHLTELPSNASKSDVTKLTESLKKQEKNIVDAIAELTGEMGKRGILKDNAQLAGQLSVAFKDITADQALQVFANLKKFARHTDDDMIMDPSISPLLVVADDKYAKAIDGVVNTHYDPAIQKHLDANPFPPASGNSQGAQINDLKNIGRGDAFERARAIILRKSVLEGKDQEHALMVLRHEFGHDNANRLDNAFRSEGAKTIRQQAEALSRLARGDHWTSAETIIKNVDKSLLKAEKQGLKGPALQELHNIKAKAVAELDYLKKPRELLADSWAMLNRSEKDMIKFKKEFPDIYKVMHQNSAIKNMLGETEAAVDLKTLDMSMIPDRRPTIADLGEVSIQASTGTVKYAKGVVHTPFGTNTNIRAKRFNVLTEQDSEHASAYYYAAHKRKHPVPSNSDVPWTDFPSLNAIMQDAKAGVLIKPYNIEMPDGTTKLFNFGGSEFQTAEEQIGAFSNTYLQLKKEAVSRIRNSSIAGKRSTLTESEIARITDSHERFVFHGGNAPDQNMDTIPFWTENYHPEKITMVRAKYKIKSEFGDKNRAESLQDIEMRHKESLTSAHNSVIAYSAMIGTGISDGLPTPSHISGYNHAQEVSAGTALKGAFTSVGGEYGKVESFVQSVANFNENFKKKFYGAIDNEVGGAALALKNDNVALQEAAVLDSVLRQKFYKFSPVTNANTLGADMLEFLSGYAKNEAALERTTAIIEAIEPTLKAGLAKGTVLWTRNLEEALASAMQTKKFGPSVLTRISNEAEAGLHSISSPKLVNFWKVKTNMNSRIVEGKQTIAGIRGFGSNLDPEVLYPGAYNTQKFKHMAFVEPRKNGMFTDDKAGIIGATTAEGLIAKKAQIKDAFGDDALIVEAADITRHKKLMDKYLKDLDMTENSVDSLMRRNGVLWDVIPEASPDIIDHYVRDMKGQAKGIVDNMTESAYADEFAALRFQSDRLQAADSTGGKRPVTDPNKEAMDIMTNNSGDSDSFWRTTQQDADRLVSAAFTTAKSMLSSAKTPNDYKKLNAYMEEAGLPLVYDKKVGTFLNQNEGINEQVLSEAIPMANGLAATFMLRLDYIQPLVTAMSTPITGVPELKHLIDSLPALKQQQLRSSLETIVPRGADEMVEGVTQHAIPSTAKLMWQAAKDYWKRPDLVKQYTELGFTPSIVQEMREQAERLALDPAVLKTSSGWQKFKGHATEIINTLATPADKTEGFVKFVAARAADLALTAGGITDMATKHMAINTYVKRVHGNYTYAQRPKMFQGFAGQAIGLFQTYQFNMYQQLFRHIGDKKAGASAAMTGLQTGIFGAQSLPFFQTLNNHIGERSLDGQDFYTGTQDIMGDEVSDWILYGAGSNFTKPMMAAANYIGVIDTAPQGLSLFTRGDMTPRSAILLPTSIDELPAVNLTTKFINNVMDSANALAGGVPVGRVFADALAKNGVNRPLSGIGQIFGGAKTTSKGGLIASQQDLDWWQGLTKVAGTSTLDEGIATQHYYRAKGYDTWRREQLNHIGSNVKAMIRAGEFDGETYNEVFEGYAKRGGRADYYQRWIHDQYMGATSSQINEMRLRHDSISGKYLQNLMGSEVETTINPTYNIEQ